MSGAGTAVRDTADGAAEQTQVLTPVRRSGLRRVLGISASLLSSQAMTSVLGLLFWTLAARSFTIESVGVAAAAVSMMTLLGSLGSLGLGTLLISRLPLTAPGTRRVLVRTCLLAAGTAGTVLAVVVPLVGIHVFGIENLRPIAGSPWALAGLAVGTGLMSVVLVLDQAVLTVGVGSLQVERNIAASVIKILALLGLAFAGFQGGMSIFLAWTVGTLLSLPLTVWRTRHRDGTTRDARLIDLALLSGLRRMALSHHALNTTLQGALQILPIIVTVILSTDENSYFNSALMVCGFVFALPYAIAIGVFASARGDEHEVLSRLKLTISMSLAVSVTAYVVLYPLAGFVLSLLGADYVDEGVPLLRILALAGVPFVIKDHYVALRRVQNRTTNAVRVLAGFLVLELLAAVLGALYGGSTGLCAAWVAVLFGEALVLAFPLWRGWRQHQKSAAQKSAARKSAAQKSAARNSTAEGTPIMKATTPMAPRPAPPRPAPAGSALARPAPTPRPAAVRAPAPGSPPIGESTQLIRLPMRSQPVALGRRNELVGSILLIMSFGVAVMAVAAAGTRGQDTAGWPQVAWVLGQVLIVGPAVFRIVESRTGGGERVVLAVAAGILLQISRTVLYPVHFAFHDEQLHMTTWRQLHDSGHLFELNPLLPVSGFYPGLEIVMDAVVRLTGLSPFVSVTLVLLVARIIMMLALIGLIRILTGSGRAATIGAVIYLCNPQMLFFNSQFSYQTLALPLAVFTTYAFVVRRRGTLRALVAPLAGLIACTLTHHLTSLLLVGALGMWLIVELLFGGRGNKGRARRAWRRLEVRDLTIMTVAGAAASLLGMLNPGSPVLGYLTEIFVHSGTGIAGLAEGEALKPAFSDSAGSGPAPWEQALLITSVLLTGVMLLMALVRIRAAFRQGDVAGIVLALVALVYPVVPLGHLTVATAETGDRAAGFVYIGLGVVVGWWLARRDIRGRPAAAVSALVVVVFLGGVIFGAGPTGRQLPGSYLVAADARSIDADNLAAADWELAHLPPDSRVFADRIAGLLASSDGGQFTVRHLSTRVDASRLLLDPAYTENDVELIRAARIDYLVVDLRLSRSLPRFDVYVETGEYEGRTRTAPVPAAALEKFGAVPGVSRIYDNGSVQIYDVRTLRDAD